MQGLFVPFACIGSGDLVRVLRLYTTNTLDTLWSIYSWDICTTCCYRSYVLLYWLVHSHWLKLRFRLVQTNAPTLYCVVLYKYACVDISRMVFWDRSRSTLREMLLPVPLAPWTSQAVPCLPPRCWWIFTPMSSQTSKGKIVRRFLISYKDNTIIWMCMGQTLAFAASSRASLQQKHRRHDGVHAARAEIEQIHAAVHLQRNRYSHGDGRRILSSEILWNVLIPARNSSRPGVDTRGSLNSTTSFIASSTLTARRFPTTITACLVSCAA